MILSLQREVLLVQLDGLRCRLFTGERQNYNPSDPRGCGMPLKTCGENRFLWPQSSDLYFTVWGELTCRATSGAGCVCTNFPSPPPPAPSWLPQLERWELNSPVVKQQQTSLPDGMVERGKDCGRGEVWTCRRDKCKEDRMCFLTECQAKQVKRTFFWKDMTVSKQCPHCDSKHCIM